MEILHNTELLFRLIVMNLQLDSMFMCIFKETFECNSLKSNIKTGFREIAQQFIWNH